MAEPKRWFPVENCGSAEMVQARDDGKYVTSEALEFVDLDDYTTLSRERGELRRAFERAEADVQALSREVERLRKIEECAKELLRQAGDEFGHMDGTRLRAVHDADVTALAEACGRKG